ncbi:hypothetical protein RL3606 [Rhizobium johnstonii 3841]|uniref:Uncharacterized protein n=1 Tax=Rhizobium johnstonii (strain DSM 114642 / LMG 32736 / 3841) TaxID=216596 RepID=Q1MD82_RHIJ3|nr:hypothetical protein RL3606 [Rhizobium johnstonii 3841]
MTIAAHAVLGFCGLVEKAYLKSILVNIEAHTGLSRTVAWRAKKLQLFVEFAIWHTGRCQPKRTGTSKN